jgi:hypothetical protein
VVALTWDSIGDRTFQTGVDRGVLYPHDGPAVPWNGLIGVEEGSNSELKSYYIDGVKYLENLSPGEYVGKLSAFTYPDKFEELCGLAVVTPGLIFHEQPFKPFDLSYRTRVGSALNGVEHGYKIHILYNLLANPDTKGYGTIGETVSPTEFSWSLTGTPPRISHFRPTVHVVVDSSTTPPEVLRLIEERLYGSETGIPSLPKISELAEYFGFLGALLIIDNGDGSWTALDYSDTYITMLDETTFQIDNVDGTVDGDSYTISSTNVGGGV